MHLLICYTTHFPCLHSCISTSVCPSIVHTFGVRSLAFMPSTLSNPVCSPMDFFSCSPSLTSGIPLHMVSRILHDSRRFSLRSPWVSPCVLRTFAGFLLVFPSTQYVQCNQLSFSPVCSALSFTVCSMCKQPHAHPILSYPFPVV